MIDSDLDFQNKEREARNEGSDPHASHVKMYAIDRNPAQSPEYDKLYQDLRKLLGKLGIVKAEEDKEQKDKPNLTEEEKTILKGKFQLLQEGWEKNHPGMKFILQPTS